MGIQSKFHWVSEDRQYVIMNTDDIPDGTLRYAAWLTVDRAVAAFQRERPAACSHDREAVRGLYAVVPVSELEKARNRPRTTRSSPAPRIPSPEVLKSWEDALAAAPPLYDGLPAEVCLEIYANNQRSDFHAGDKTWKPRALTPSQKTAARELWSAQLKAKTKATEDKERNRVLADREFEDYE